MLREETMDKLYQMRLHGMVSAIRRQTEQRSDYAALSFEERLGLLVEEEWTWRDSQRLRLRLRHARLKQQACVEDVDYKHSRGLDRGAFRELARCRWIADKDNLLITGPTGLGKSYLACALGNQACREGFSVVYTRLPKLLADLQQARLDGSHARLMKRLGKANLLVIDDWGLAPLGDADRRDLLELSEDRYDMGAFILTSQLPVKAWHAYIGDDTIADAILDRLVHNSHRIELKGETMREKETKARLRKRKGGE